MAAGADLHIDEDLVDGLIETLRLIGQTESGGLTRLGLSDLERQAMDTVGAALDNFGFSVRFDEACNLRARLGDASGPAVMTGSHLDSVIEGGHYDGPAGVVCAVAAAEALTHAGRAPARPLELVVFTSEEGSRFGAGLLGSTALVRGLTDVQLGRSGPDGVTVADALARLGGDPDAIRTPILGSGDVDAFIEVHIEQGTVLEEKGAPVGVVTGIAAPVFLRGEIVGVADHAGATPMDRRSDAFLGLAEIALAAEEAARKSDGTVATVGTASVHPGSMNIIPGRASFTLDVRDLDVDARDRVEQEIQSRLDEVADRRRLTWSLDTLQREDPVPTDPDVRAAIADAVREATEEEPVELPSRAAHDTMVMADIAKVGMLFVRCLDGRSHCPEESATTADLVVAAQVLAGALARLTG